MQDQFSSRKVGVQAAVCKTIETEVIPVLEQQQKVSFPWFLSMQMLFV